MVSHACNGNTRRKKKGEKGTEELLEVIMSETFPKLMTNNQITHPGYSGNTRHRIKILKKKINTGYTIFKLQEIKHKEKS